MTILEKLTFSDKTQAAVMTSPEARIRTKMVDRGMGCQLVTVVYVRIMGVSRAGPGN